MSKLKLNQRVYHSYFSAEYGTVLEYRKDPDEYNYLVQWNSGDKDWYKEKALVAVS